MRFETKQVRVTISVLLDFVEVAALYQVCNLPTIVEIFADLKVA